MLDSGGAARLRELQHRAYAPGGGLDPEEAAELQELQRRRVAASGASGAAVSGPAVSADLGGSSGFWTAGADASEEAASIRRIAATAGSPSGEPDASDHPARSSMSVVSVSADLGGSSGFRTAGADASEEAASVRTAEIDDAAHPPRRSLRRRLLPVVIAAASALAAGLGIGWLVFGADAGRPLTAEQSAVLADLESEGGYDPGSIELLGEKDGVTAWSAARDDAKQQCLVLVSGAQRQPSCLPADSTADDAWGRLGAQIQTEDGRQVYATLIDDIDGVPRAVIQKLSMYQEDDDSWRQMYGEEELAIVDVLVADGYDGPSLNLIGYDGETPVWMSYDGEDPCLMVADSTGVIGKACGAQPLGLALPGVTYVVTTSPNRGDLLTVYRQDRPLSVDDKTGETE